MISSDAIPTLNIGRLNQKLDRKQETGLCPIGLGVLLVELHQLAVRGCPTFLAKDHCIKSRSKIVFSEAPCNKITEI